MAQVQPAEKVALSILRQAERGNYMIFPGQEAHLIHLLSSKLPRGLVYAVLDWLAAQGRKGNH